MREQQDSFALVSISLSFVIGILSIIPLYFSFHSYSHFRFRLLFASIFISFFSSLSLVLHVYSNDVRSLSTQTLAEYPLQAVSLFDEKDKNYNPPVRVEKWKKRALLLELLFAFFFSLFDISPMIERCTVTTAMDVTVISSNMVLVRVLLSLGLLNA